jgi:hypothetical protein
VQLPVQLLCNPRVTGVQLRACHFPAYPCASGTLARHLHACGIGVGINDVSPLKAFEHLGGQESIS